jgi:adenosylcobyric acid synthase
MAKALMIQGTGSGAGKSLIVTALCRIFRNEGINVAPFKAQNMALNSYVTVDGGEIGRAQALQAEAAKIEPAVDMNPILLKASGDMGSQVIMHGKVHSTMKAQKYYSLKKIAWKAVTDSYNRLSMNHELIIMEGAGSPAEINLMDFDIVNMMPAKHAGAPVFLVGDIDRGGVFASIYGTVKLLGRDSRYIRAFIINKFRGDMGILAPGLEMIKDKTGKPVIGVLPYIKDIGLPEEDGLSLQEISNFKLQSSNSEKIKIVIIKLQYISNFTDFDPFLYEPDVDLIYSNNPADIENAFIVIIPGSKNTVKDLLLLKERCLDRSIKRAYEKGIQIIGICGGYQMLGKKIYDPYGVESPHKKVDGIGLLNIETTLERTKVTSQVEAEIAHSSWLKLAHCSLLMDANKSYELSAMSQEPNYKLSAMRHQPLKGYEIHMGTSKGDIGLFRINRSSNPPSPPFSKGGMGGFDVLDGSLRGNCWGSYLHGIFENDLLRRSVINHSRQKKGLKLLNTHIDYCKIKDAAIEKLADIVKENMDIDFIKKVIRL